MGIDSRKRLVCAHLRFVMRRYFRLVLVTGVLLAVVSLASAGSVNDSFSGAALTGVSGTASGSFTFDSVKDTFSNLSLSFDTGVFKGIGAKDNNGGQATCILNLCGFSWRTIVNGDSIWNTIVLNIQTGQYQDFGGIYNWKNRGGFDYLSVAEGGATLAYLMLSALAVFAGIFISGKHRRGLYTSRSN